MNGLDEYLQGPYREDRREIEEAGRRLECVWPVFTEFYSDEKDKEGWPYEIEAGHDPEIPPFSFSTNAMILFAMGVSLGRVESFACHLTPRVVYVPDLGVQEARVSAVNASALKAFVAKAQAGPVFESGSFGKDDPFTLAWALNLVRAELKPPPGAALSDADKAQNELRARLMGVAWKRVADAFEKPSVSMLDYPDADKKKIAPLDHPFPLLRAVQLYRTLTDIGRQDPATLAARAGDVEATLRDNVRPHLLNRAYEHLSLSEVKNGAFDAAELVFALEGVLLADADARAVDPNLVERVFAVIERSQDASPYWRPLKPFVTNNRGFALLPLSVEIANSLLRMIKLLDHDDVKRPHLTARMPLLRRYAQWLYTRMVKGSLARSGGPAVEYAGWHSEHVHAPRRVHTWETAQVAIFLMHYRTMLQEYVALTSRERANVAVRALKRDKGDYATEEATTKHLRGFEPLRGVADARDAKAAVAKAAVPPGSPPPPSAYEVYGQLQRLFIEPRLRPATSSAAPAHSMLLYGPPGTGKSTVGEELARALDWELLTLTPSDFITGGEAQVEARAKALFKMLEEQPRTVVLLDEIDRMILDRDSKYYVQQSDIFQFMTPGMLVKLKDLWERKRCIFIVATNYAERIDPAAKRLGRIDATLLVNPPDRAQRAHILKSQTVAAVMKGRAGTMDGSKARAQKQVLRDIMEVIGATAKFGQAVDATVLMAFGEITRIAKEAAQRFLKDKVDDFAPADKDALAGAFNDAAKDIGSPAIRLQSYAGRFRKTPKGGAPGDPGDNDFPSAQEPSAEFLLLVHLLVEVKNVRADDLPLIRQVLERLSGKANVTGMYDNDPGATANVAADLKAIIGDQDMVDVLMKDLRGLPLKK